MSTATEDRKSPIEKLLEGVPFRDIGNATELAPDTPLTREAVIHLRAATQEVEDGYMRASAMVATVRRRLASPEWWSSSEDELLELAELLRNAEEIMREAMLTPVSERGRGERAHGGIVEGEGERAS